MSRALFQITGMSCASCAARIEKGVEGSTGVSRAVVNLATGELLVEYDDALTDPGAIAASVRGLGFGASRQEGAGELSFGIRGLHCASCVATVEKKLLAHPGITSAAVNLATESAFVTFDPEATTRSAIFAVVAAAGYHPVQKEGDDAGKALRTQRNWLVFSIACSLPIMFTMGMHHHRSVGLLNLVLATAVQFTAGLTFYAGAWSALKNRSANMDLLVALGTSAAYFYSLFAWFGILPGDVFFETSAMLIAFIRLGKYLEARARGKAGEALRKLLRLQADRARLLVDGEERLVPASSVRKGDVVLVRPGDTVPVDGVVLEGNSALDESLVTGESVPAEKGAGDAVAGGTVNRTGLLTVRATRIGEETLLSQIVRMVQEAQADKAPIQRFADRVSSWFVPAVVLLALLTFAFWTAVLGEPFRLAFQLAIAVVVIACPCSMGLATPTAIMVGSGVGLNRGILIKRGSALENISTVQVALLDKTGTLTQGKPVLTDVVPAPGVAPEELLEHLGAAESGSNHPLAEAAVRGVRERGVSFGAVASFTEMAGFGVACEYGGKSLVVGNPRHLTGRGISVGPLEGPLGPLLSAGKTVVYVAAGDRLLGAAALADRLKEGASGAVAALRDMGIRTVMITGDQKVVAAAIAEAAGVDAFEAGVLPERKQQVVKEHQEKGLRVAMVGDGINDAPALAQADVGIAVGGGADIAKETGDIILVKDDISDVVRAVRLGKATLSKVKQNLFWALFYNVLGIPVAAGALYYPLGITLKPEFAGLAMALSSVSVVMNSLMLKRIERSL